MKPSDIRKCTCEIVTCSAVWCYTTVDDMQGLEQITHLEKRFRMRPAGVVSKKVMGDLKIA